MYGRPGDDYLIHVYGIAKKELRRRRYQRWFFYAWHTLIAGAVAIGAGAIW